MKNILFLSDYNDQEEFEAVFYELKKYNIFGLLTKPTDITFTNMNNKINLFFNGNIIKPDLVIGYAFDEDLLPAMKILKILSSAGVPILNSGETLFYGQNKDVSSVLLNNMEGIRHLPFYKFSDYLDMEHINAIGFPLVLKPVNGACGKGLYKFLTKTELFDWFDLHRMEAKNYFAQPYIEKWQNKDFRIVCVNYKAVYAYDRRSSDGGWITNLTANGIGNTIPMDQHQDLIIMSQIAARTIRAPFCGVDIAYDKNKEPFIIEANTCPTIKVSRYISEASNEVESAFAEYINSIVHENI